jgi:antitoxin ParD1/3/4
MAMNVSLTRALEDFVNRKVSSGRYGSASEVVREALRLLEDKDRVREAQLGELRAEIAKGLDQLDTGAGEPMDVGKIKTRGRQQLSRKRRG